MRQSRIEIYDTPKRQYRVCFHAVRGGYIVTVPAPADNQPEPSVSWRRSQGRTVMRNLLLATSFLALAAVPALAQAPQGPAR